MYKMLENRYETLRLKRKSWIRYSHTEQRKSEGFNCSKKMTLGYTLLAMKSKEIFMNRMSRETSFCCRHNSLTEFVWTSRHISCGIESRYIRLLPCIYHYCTVRIFCYIKRVKQRRIWDRADRDEYPIWRKGITVFEENIRHPESISTNFFYDRIIMHRNIRGTRNLIHPDIFRSHTISSNENMDFFRERCKVEWFCDRGVPTSYHWNGESSKKIPVTRRTIRYSFPEKRILSWNTEVSILISRCEEQSPWSDTFSSQSRDTEWKRCEKLYLWNTILQKLRTCVFCLFEERIHNLSSTRRDNSWPVLDFVRCCECASWHLTNDYIFQLISRCIHAGGKTSTSSTDNDEVIVKHRGGMQVIENVSYVPMHRNGEYVEKKWYHSHQRSRAR